jgi:hypothetical protein
MAGIFPETILGYDADGNVSLILLVEDVGGQLKITAVKGEANINGIYAQGTGDSFDGFTTIKGKITDSVNMNGSGVAWDSGFKLSDPGLGKDGQFAGQSTFLTEGESILVPVPADWDLSKITEIGIRATSTTTAEGSIKGIGEDPPPPPDDFPEWEQDISNIVLVFEQTDGDEKPNPDGDGYYTVKIDNWPVAADDDLDKSIEAILEWLEDNDPNFTSADNLLGVIIKGGQQDTQFYAYGDNNENGTAPDALPSGLGLGCVITRYRGCGPAGTRAR